MAQIPHADPGKDCPLWQRDMAEVCHKCPWWQHLRGAHPQTGAEVDEWGCAVAWLPVLLIETAKEARSTGASVDSFRNVMVKLNTEQPGLPYAGPSVLLPDKSP